ncbi:hypothetical protein B0H14DRAFT_3465924 [Mycena olivaceomarginata]|nr:hypothetical protein B0H14DRAFT_3465924 [Mycena olivaceomarginata]
MTAPPVASVTAPIPEPESAAVTSVDFTLGMERIIPVYAPPWTEPLPVTTVMPSKEDAMDVLARYLTDDDFVYSTWFTDGSLMQVVQQYGSSRAGYGSGSYSLWVRVCYGLQSRLFTVVLAAFWWSLTRKPAQEQFSPPDRELDNTEQFYTTTSSTPRYNLAPTCRFGRCCKGYHPSSSASTPYLVDIMQTSD